LLIGKEEIARLLPHAGNMVLIDGVTSWDETSIVCVTESHRSPTNPLRLRGRLASVHAIEYAAQAAAIHGGLIECGKAPLRLLAAVRQAAFVRPWLDDLRRPIRIEAKTAFLDPGAAVYVARLLCEEEAIASMRLTLMTIQAADNDA
jgi:predicted hotdog family 3-hydroxylacyl-ACP dehydratase